MESRQFLEPSFTYFPVRVFHRQQEGTPQKIFDVMKFFVLVYSIRHYLKFYSFFLRPIYIYTKVKALETGDREPATVPKII